MLNVYFSDIIHNTLQQLQNDRSVTATCKEDVYTNVRSTVSNVLVSALQEFASDLGAGSETEKENFERRIVDTVSEVIFASLNEFKDEYPKVKQNFSRVCCVFVQGTEKH